MVLWCFRHDGWLEGAFPVAGDCQFHVAVRRLRFSATPVATVAGLLVLERIFGIAQVRVQFALEHGLERVRKQVFERGLNVVRRLDIVAGNELFELVFR